MMYEVVVAGVEVFMTALLIFFINETHRLGPGSTFKKLAAIVLVLSMMASMFNSLTYYVIGPPGFLTTIIAFSIGMLLMSIVIVILLMLVSLGKMPVSGFILTLSLAFLFVWNEASMGTFLYALSAGIHGASSGNFLTIIAYGINGYLFVIPMIVEMGFFLAIERTKSIMLVLTLSIIFMSLFDPLLLGLKWFVIYGIVLTSVTMLVFMLALIFLVARRTRDISKTDVKATEFVLPVYVLMSAGLLVGAYGSYNMSLFWLFYAFTALIAMGLYFSLFLSGLIRKASAPNVRATRSFVLIIVTAAFLSMVFAFSAVALSFSVI